MFLILRERKKGKLTCEGCTEAEARQKFSAAKLRLLLCMRGGLYGNFPFTAIQRANIHSEIEFWVFKPRMLLSIFHCVFGACYARQNVVVNIFFLFYGVMMDTTCNFIMLSPRLGQYQFPLSFLLDVQWRRIGLLVTGLARFVSVHDVLTMNASRQKR